MGKWIVLAVALGAGYWYWTGPYNAGRPSSEEVQLRENAAKMQACMRREESMEGLGGLAGVGGHQPVGPGDARAGGHVEERLGRGHHVTPG